MKKIITLVALFSFAVGLNAAITKEDIYNTNPTQFNSLKKELLNIQEKQTEEQKKIFEKQQVAKAIKTVLSNKELLKNANYAVIKNGQIIKTSNAKDEDGLLLWHEHSANLQDTPPANTCRIYAPTWESLTFDNPCGNIKFQVRTDSPYAHIQSVPTLWLFPNDDTINSWISYYTQHNIISDSSFLDYNALLATPVPNETSLISMWLSHQVITDTFNHSGYVSVNDYNSRILNKPYGQSPFLPVDINFENAYFRPTEYYYQGENIITLKSGNYVQLLYFVYPVNYNDWSQGYYVILKWVNMTVENYYLNDVSIQNNVQNNTKITFNNRSKEILISLANSVDLNGKVYQIYNILGQLQTSGEITSHNMVVPMPSKLASGIYIIRTNVDNLTEKFSFVK